MRIIAILGLEGDFQTNDIPNQYDALPKDPQGDPVNEGFISPPAVGMMWYLCNITRMDT